MKKKKNSNAFRHTVASCFCTSPSIYTFTRSPPFALDCSFHVFFCTHFSLTLSLFSLPQSLVVSHPRRRSGLIIISQARPHQETWLLMREKSIPLSRPLPSLSLPQSILSRCSSPPPHPSTPSFLIRQIPRELEAISAAGTGVTCVCVCVSV